MPIGQDSMEDVDLYENVSDYNESDAKSGGSQDIKPIKKGKVRLG